MKKIYRFQLILSLIVSAAAVDSYGQEAAAADYRLLFQSGIVTPEYTIADPAQLPKPLTDEIVNGRFYRLVQFNAIPSQENKVKMEAMGIRFLDYIPNLAYFISFPSAFNFSDLASFGLRSVSVIQPTFKLSEDLAKNTIPEWAQCGDGIVAVKILCFSDVQLSAVMAELEIRGMKIKNSDDFSKIVTVHLNESALQQAAAFPFVSFIEPIDAPSEPENLVERTSHRSNTIATENPLGRQYTGKGVVVALGDDGVIGPHIDYTGRVDITNVSSNTGNHGDHVAGIIFGAGNKDPVTRGMGFGAFVYAYDVWEAVDNTPTTYNSLAVRLTSLSYGNGNNTGYTSYARTADQQIRQMPSLMHVFSAGNSGTSDYGYGAGAGWGNITGGIKVAKNVIAVGNLSSTDGLSSSSSRGPAKDGRIKPDVCAVGSSVNSTVDVNTYQVKSGTSMACPGVTGTLTQLYQAYRELNGGQDPNSGLLKGILQNTAEDLGNAGPDFKYGYGRINALRAVRTLENNYYLQATVAQGASNNHTINVPAGAKQIRVMVYWNDYEGAANATKALVNDLDIVVKDPSAASFNPWVLDKSPDAATLNLPAVRGVDRLNNMEQVTLDNPASGAYTVTVSGFQVPQGPQSYFVIWYFIYDEIEITYPIGRESFVPSKTETVRWDAWGTTGSFTVEYSSNNGSTWSVLSSTVAGTARHYNWAVPSALTGKALIRVKRNSLVDVSDTTFSIIAVPANLKVDWACPASLQLSWTAVSGATGYEVSMLGNEYMDSIGTTSGTTFIVSGISSVNTYWFSVKALGPNDAVGLRAIAIQKNPGTTTNCPPTNMEERLIPDELTVYPNPGKDIFELSFNSSESEVQIAVTDITGKTVFVSSLQSGSSYREKIDLSHLASGIYYLHLKTASNVVTKKIGIVEGSK